MGDCKESDVTEWVSRAGPVTSQGKQVQSQESQRGLSRPQAQAQSGASHLQPGSIFWALGSLRLLTCCSHRERPLWLTAHNTPTGPSFLGKSAWIYVRVTFQLMLGLNSPASYPRTSFLGVGGTVEVLCWSSSEAEEGLPWQSLGEAGEPCLGHTGAGSILIHSVSSVASATCYCLTWQLALGTGWATDT